MHRKKEMDSYWQHEFVQLIFPIVVRTKGCTIVDPEPLQPYFGDNVSQSGAYDRLRGQGVVEVCVCVYDCFFGRHVANRIPLGKMNIPG